MSDHIYIDGLPPVKAHPDDAAFDLRAEHNAIVGPGEATLIDCGFAIVIPEGHVGLVCSRSGLALKQGVFVVNAPGVIDPGYRGNVGVILATLGKEFVVMAGDRIAQLLIIPAPSYRLVQSKNMLEQPTARGEGGFGSTGVGRKKKPTLPLFDSGRPELAEEASEMFGEGELPPPAPSAEGIYVNPDSHITFPLGGVNPFAPVRINCESCGSPECREACMT